MFKYPMWANLSDEGKKAWGSIFVENQIPILNPFSQKANMEGQQEKFDVYAINWFLVESERKEAILQKLSDKFGAPKDVIKADIEKIGLPLQAKYVCSVGIDPRFLI